MATISAATALQSLVSATTTLAPSAASALAKIAPSAAFGPAAAPVTIATFPFKRGIAMYRLAVGWVEHPEPHQWGGEDKRRASLRSTHPTSVQYASCRTGLRQHR